VCVCVCVCERVSVCVERKTGESEQRAKSAWVCCARVCGMSQNTRIDTLVRARYTLKLRR